MKFFKIILFFIPFLLLLQGFFHPVFELSQDLGRHIKTGEIIVQTISIPTTNLYSYTYPNFPFVNHHWLSEVIFYQLSTFSTLEILLLFKLIIIAFAFFSIYLYSWRRYNPYIVFLCAIVYIPILFERTHIRPELFSYLLISYYGTILYRFREKSTPLLFTLPLLQLLWVNLHIYFFTGLFLIFLFFIDSCFKYRKELTASFRKKAHYPLPPLTIGLVGGVSLLLSLINPNFMNGLLYPLRVFNNYGYSIEENQTIWFLWNYSQKETIVSFVFAVVLLYLGLILTRKKARLIDWLLALSFTVFGYFAIRNIPLFVFTTFIPFCYAYSTLFTDNKNRFVHFYKNKQFITLFVCTILIGILFYHTIQKIPTNANEYTVKEYGKNAILFYKNNNLRGPLFNNFDIGSYIEYKLYPQEKVFVDGRPEAYPSNFFKDTYIPMQEDPRIFNVISEKYKFNTIFFAHTDQTPWAQMFLHEIHKNPDWKIVYLDDAIIILTKNIPQNEEIIQKYEISKVSKSPTYTTWDSYMRLAYIYSIFEWKDKEKEMYEKILKLEPTNCLALYNMAVLTQEDTTLSQVYQYKYSQACN